MERFEGNAKIDFPYNYTNNRTLSHEEQPFQVTTHFTVRRQQLCNILQWCVYGFNGNNKNIIFSGSCRSSISYVEVKSR